ncbi:DUF4865 family protein [Saccharothrix sp. NPDC042600]|uniref:DUF4865 family protein n=1 Tax=Saccharothrix TaxID=2071 RepID=UPI0033CE6B88|nr:DUF4865 family protein [Saccharothrix mutabilis subsp. capreolus]
MHAMHYEITLPADYDMSVIHKRVATKGSALDAWPGLACKAYLVRERGVDGSPVNQYAPFYLWRTVEGMNTFLWGPGFAGLSRDFGRPVVRQWTGLAFEAFDLGAVPRSATKRTWHVPADADPVAAIEEALEGLKRLEGGAHSTALVVDTRGWELVQFTLWVDEVPAEAEGQRYRVHHLSRPELGELPTGRLW